MAVDVRDHVPAIGLEALRGVVGEPAGPRRRRWRCRCRRRARSACSASACRPASRPRARCLPSGSRRRGTRRCGGRRSSRRPSRLNSAASSASPSAMPTALARPWPSGPVVVSTPGGDAVLRVARRLGVQLAEVLQLLDRQVVAGQVQQRVEQHRAVAVGQHEAVAVGPVRVGRVVAQVVATTGRRRYRPCPSACRGGRSWLAARHPSLSARMALAIREVVAGDEVVMSSPENESRKTGHGSIRKLAGQPTPARDAAPSGREADGAIRREAAKPVILTETRPAPRRKRLRDRAERRNRVAASSHGRDFCGAASRRRSQRAASCLAAFHSPRSRLL